MKDLSFVLSIGNSEYGELSSESLKVNWDKDLEINSKVYLNLNIKDAIIEKLVEEVKNSITFELIEELTSEAMEIINE